MILAIDPGPINSGWCLYDDLRRSVLGSGVMSNPEILADLAVSEAGVLAVERVASYGMAVGKDVFETCEWVGEFRGAWRSREMNAILIYRRDVKLHLCGSARAKDQNIRAALLDLFPATGGGKTPQIGTKSQPGPLYGVTSHAWSALAVAVTALATLR